MNRANDGAGEHLRLVRMLRQCRDRSGMTLVAAEVAWRTMPAELLSRDTVRAILATVVQRQATDPAFLVWQAWSEGVYWDKAEGDRESYWTPIVPVAAVVPDSCHIIGLVTGSESMEGTMSLPSESLPSDIGAMVGSVDSREIEAGLLPGIGTDLVVYEVLLDCRGLDRWQTNDLSRGLVEWDACLDPRGLDARQWTWRHELRCDRADYDQSNVVGLFLDWS